MMKELLLVVLCSVLLSSCYLLTPPPSYVVLDVKLQGSELVFTDYWGNIKKERELRRSYYFVTSVDVTSDGHEVFWRVSCENTDVDNMTLLPDFIIYGKNPCLNEMEDRGVEIEALPLPIDTPLMAIVGVRGANKNGKYKIYFSAGPMQFKLKKNTAGELSVVYYGKEEY